MDNLDKLNLPIASSLQPANCCSISAVPRNRMTRTPSLSCANSDSTPVATQTILVELERKS